MQNRVTKLRSQQAIIEREAIIYQSRNREIQLLVDAFSLRQKFLNHTPRLLSNGEFARLAIFAMQKFESESLLLLLEEFCSMHRQNSPGHFQYFSLFSNRLELRFEDLIPVVEPLLHYLLQLTIIKDEIVLMLIFGFFRRLRDKIALSEELITKYGGVAFHLLTSFSFKNEELLFLLVDNLYSLSSTIQGLNYLTTLPFNGWRGLTAILHIFEFYNKSLQKKLYNNLKNILLLLPFLDHQAHSRIEAKFMGIDLGIIGENIDLPTWLFILWEENWRFLNEIQVKRWLNLAQRRPLEKKRVYLKSLKQDGGPTCFYHVLDLFKKSIKDRRELHLTVSYSITLVSSRPEAG